MTWIAKSVRPRLDEAVPPLQHGDRLEANEFERRWAGMPDLKKAELIEGMVYVPAEYTGRLLNSSIPPLENGDRLTRAEFERRWENMLDLKKAELLNGEVFMSPPVSATNHGIPHSELMLWLGLYRVSTPGVTLADNSTWRLASGDDSQPDAMLFVLPDHGGMARFDEDGCVRGAPELVAEIAASSASYDLHLKTDIFLRNGAKEYLVWRTLDRAFTWLALRGERYEPLPPGPDGIHRSEVFPGLWLDTAALLRGDLPAVARVLQTGLGAPEHARFAKALQQAAKQPIA
jgi:Uma2 family endonuclease